MVYVYIDPYRLKSYLKENFMLFYNNDTFIIANNENILFKGKVTELYNGYEWEKWLKVDIYQVKELEIFVKEFVKEPDV